MKKIFKIKKHKFIKKLPLDMYGNISGNNWGNGIDCVSIYMSNTLGLTWIHLVTYLGNQYDEKDFYIQQEELFDKAKEEIKNLYKTENCKHKNKHEETVNHPGGEVGIGLICDECDKLLKYN